MSTFKRIERSAAESGTPSVQGSTFKRTGTRTIKPSVQTAPGTPLPTVNLRFAELPTVKYTLPSTKNEVAGLPTVTGQESGVSEDSIRMEYRDALEAEKRAKDALTAYTSVTLPDLWDQEEINRLNQNIEKATAARKAAADRRTLTGAEKGVESIAKSFEATPGVVAQLTPGMVEEGKLRMESEEYLQAVEAEKRARAALNSYTNVTMPDLWDEKEIERLNRNIEKAVAAREALAAEKSVAIDMDTEAMKLMGESVQLRQEATKNLSGAKKLFADTALSVGQNVALMPFAVVNPYAPLIAMGANSAAQEMYQQAQAGKSAGEAWVRGVESGVIEAVTEKLPLDNLMDMVKTGGRGFVKNMLKQAGVEATEEGVSYTLNYIADKAASDPDATFSLQELLTSAAAGGLSGLFFGVGGAAVGGISHAAGAEMSAKNPAADAGQTAAGQIAEQAGVDTLGRNTALTGEKTADTPKTTLVPGTDLTAPLEDPATIERRVRMENAKNDLQRSGIEFGVSEDIIDQTQRLSEATGRKIRFYSAQTEENGKYDRDTRTIWVNVNSKDPVAQIISHELTHSVEFADAYDELSAVVQLRIAKSGGDLEQMIQNKKTEYAAWGKKLDNRDAMQEVVAEYISKNLLTDEAAIVEMAKNNPTLTQKIVNFFDSLLAALQTKFKRAGTNSQERAEIRKMRDAFWRALQRARTGYGVSTDTAMEYMSEAYAAGEMSEEDYDDIVNVVMEEESTSGRSMLEGDPLSGRTNRDGVQYSVKRTKKVPYQEQIDAYYAKNQSVLGRNDDIYVLDMSSALDNLGLGGKPIFMLKSNLNKSTRVQGNNASNSAHGISEDVIRNIPKYINDPVLVIVQDERISVVADERVETQREKAAPLLIGIDPNSSVDGKDAYEIKSVYGRERFADWIDLRAKDSKIIVGNKEKASALLRDVGKLYSEPVAYAEDLSAKILTHSNTGVKNAILGMPPREQFSLTGKPENNAVPADETYLGEIKGQRLLTDTQAQKEGTLLLVDNLPVKAANALKNAEKAMARTMEKQLHLTRTDHLPEIARAVSEEYLRTGDVSQETADTLFAQLWNEGTSLEDTTDPFFKECAKAEFSNALAKMRLELRNVKRLALDRAGQLANEETTDLTLDEVKDLYPKLKDARRKYERAQAKNLLTTADTAMVNRILRGDAELDTLDPAEYNVAGIRAVYEAKQEYEDYAKQIRKWNQARKAELRKKADTFLRTANAWKDKKMGIRYSRETMERNFRDIIPNEQLANQVVREYITPVHNGVAESTRTKNTYRDRVRALNLSREVSKADAADGKVSEAHAVQLLGEAQDSIRMLERSRGRMKERDGKTLEDWKAVVENLWHNNPQLNQTKIEGAVEEFRKIYDELFTQMNEARVRNGYEPINYRSGYFPHFQPGDGDGVLVQFGKALGIDTAVSALPTSINGLTHTFKPGITWMGNAQERLGFNTVYDAVEGFDKYIEGCADVIHLTDSIQNLRALTSQIRYRTTEQGIRNQVDTIRADERLTSKEKEDMIQNLYNDPKTKFTLNNLVVELDEYINLLANKKSRADRNMEQALGRDMYNLVKALESRVAANMVAVNPGSWLTNFIPLTQGGAALDRGMLLKGMWDTLRAYKESDGIVDKSSFLTNRRGSDPLVRTWAQNASATLGKPMEWIDSFTADSLIRARYYQNLKRGMSEESAMSEADSWVAGVMADRSKGSMPTLFNRSNPLTKIFTQFQLEVNNQYSYLFKDLPDEAKKKGAAALIGMLLKFFLGAFLYNEVYEYVIGRRPALDPIGILNETAGDLTGYELPNFVEMGVDAAFGEEISFRTNKEGLYGAWENLKINVLEELPFIGGLLGGGRVPISSALPDVTNLTRAATDDSWSGRKRVHTALNELSKPASYLLTPFGGGQLKKAAQGLEAVARQGSYSVDAEGNEILQYPVYRDTVGQGIGNALRAAVFGKTSLATGQDWVESGFQSLGAEETQAYKNMLEAGIDAETAYMILKEMRAAGDRTGKLSVIAQADIEEDTAKELAGLVMGDEMETEKGNPTRYAELVMAIESGLTVQEAIDAQNAGADLGEVVNMVKSGADVQTARAVALALAELKGKAGNDEVTTLQKWRAAISAVPAAEDQMEALSGVMSESEYSKLRVGYGYGVKPEQYVAYKEALPKFDTDGNGSYKQAEVKAAIDSMGIRSIEIKAALWQMANKSWKPAANPYSTTVGTDVYNSLN